MSTDPSHFETDDPTVELPPAALRLRDFFITIAQAASVRDSGRWSATALRCRRRPGRKSCKGRIEVFRKDKPPEVDWRCPVCGDDGVITGWKGTYWDLSDTPATRESEDPEDSRLVEIRLSQKGFELLRDKVDLFERESERIVAAARPAGSGRVALIGRLDDVEFLVGEVAFAANHTESAHLERRLDALFARLDAALQ